MNSIAQSLKEPIKSALRHIGLYEYAVLIKRHLSKQRYRGIAVFEAIVNGVAVHFSTEDDYSNSWFFPRYAGGKLHEKVVTEMIIDSLRDAKCFVDVGANLGWYTCIAATHMPNGAVYAFEMDDLNFALLKKNIAINDLSNVEVHNMAISNSCSLVSYQRDENRPSPTFRMDASTENEKSAGRVSVHSITLDDFFQSKRIVPDVVKIDVEGAEMNVLMGMKKTLRESRPIIYLEIHPYDLQHYHTSTTSIISMLIEGGYEVSEIEDMRKYETTKRLTLLLADAVLDRNTMLYAVPAKKVRGFHRKAT